jgi:hypothetical protein
VQTWVWFKRDGRRYVMGAGICATLIEFDMCRATYDTMQ